MGQSKYHKFNKDNKVVRKALYEAYDHKCAYCADLLKPKYMHVDHILATKDKKNDDEEYNKHIEQLFNDGFILDSIENFFPTCSHCNQTKNNSNWETRNLIYFHAQAKNHASKVLSLIEKYKNNSNDFPDCVCDDSNWENINFDEQRDISHALLGYKLTEKDVLSCPSFPIVDSILKRLSIVDYVFVKGQAGSGKSISIFQVAYKLYLEKWTIFKYMDVDAKNIFMPINDDKKILLLVDDAQRLDKKVIDKIISLSSNTKKVIFAYTLSQSTEMTNAEDILINNKESVRCLFNDYSKREPELTEIISKIDENIGSHFLQSSIHKRLMEASKQDTPHKFNSLLRGDWNNIKDKIQNLKERKYSLLLYIISFLQIYKFDNFVNLEEINDCVKFFDEKITFEEVDLLYLVEKHFIESTDKIQMIHIVFATEIIKIMSSEIANTYKKALINLCVYLFKKDMKIKGFLWLYNNLTCTGLFMNNFINREFMDTIFDEKYTNRYSDEDKGCLLNLWERYSGFNYDADSFSLIIKNAETISSWISNPTYDNCYYYGQFINELINQSHRNNERAIYFLTSINLDDIKKTIKFISVNNSYGWTHYFERLINFIGIEKSLTFVDCFKVMISNFEKQLTFKNVNEYLDFLNILFLLMPDEVILSFENVESTLKVYLNNNIDYYLYLFNSFNNHYVGLYFDKYKPSVHNKKITKKLLTYAEPENIVTFINHSEHNYWQSFYEYCYIANYYKYNKLNVVLSGIDLSANEYANTLWNEPTIQLSYIFEMEYIGNKNRAESLLKSKFDIIKKLSSSYIKLFPDIAMELYDKGCKLVFLQEGLVACPTLCKESIEKMLPISNAKTIEILNFYLSDFAEYFSNFSILDFSDSDNYFELAMFLKEKVNDFWRSIVNKINFMLVKKSIDEVRRDDRFTKKEKNKIEKYLDEILSDTNKDDVEQCKLILRKRRTTKTMPQ